ncbi:penicillin-binding protein 2 [Marinitenerispora sediminis]|uniref:Penicillin-binding protein 2 n=1 Tax=Marinitenerispora sediminis TaxID=1931232 RepID=A0A368T3X7_9ACTN|nr:penicillin-binding protein 2 [Marinitenerispora sediminis]RCV52933.1 penicillin-binding protein 2 [Marinitenerispora sediminis]RCV53881.1 penicillin-binding protein 2 [Marinitenerispora sediminis]RCV57044.1 penicillin-binding protein 2 [Marinitenerispora sediminis]
MRTYPRPTIVEPPRRPGRRGLITAQVLVLSLLAVLTGRLWYLQVPMADHYRQLAAANHSQDLIIPATRGQILDGAGRPLVRNRTELVVSADFHALARQEDGGDAVLRRVAEVLGVPHAELRQRVRLCGPQVSRPCWPGSPYQPITLAEGVEPQLALQIMERQEEFPGISAQQSAVRDYPGGASAVQALGYLQPATEEELAAREELRAQFSGVTQVGRDGLEATYDEQLRGVAGVRTLAVDSRGNVTGLVTERRAQPGQHLVTSLDARVQRVVEEALTHGIERSRANGYPADSAASVVMDVRTGRVIAMASVPTYDPEVWDGGIDQRTYDRLLSEEAGEPLISRALQGQFPPASTFKVSSLAAAVENGSPLRGTYSCPSSINVGDRAFHNYESNAHGSLSLHQAIVVSCNTVFYQLAYDMWKADGGMRPKEEPRDAMSAMAKGFGFGKPTGIDLPNESVGRIPDRDWKLEYWESTREDICRRAKSGYPEVARKDPAHAAYLQAVAKEQCVDGYVWRAGDAANFAIGQGDVLVTPLQLARAYAAIANGGTLYAPRVGKAFISADGEQVEEIPPKPNGRLPVSDETLAYLRAALADVPKKGTAAGAFHGFPQDRVSIAGKTGSATVVGKRESAWFASYAPADDPQLAVVVLISQGGTGGTAAAPVAREIYDGIYGFEPPEDLPEAQEAGQEQPGPRPGDQREGRPRRAPRPALPGGVPPAQLPVVRPDGTVAAPAGYE